MTRKPPSRSPLLIQVLAALGGARFTETQIVDFDNKVFVDGLTDGKHVWINPSSDVVHTIFHELIHVLKPAWSERTVQREATRLLRQMNEGEIWEAYLIYNRRVKRPRRKRTDDA